MKLIACMQGAALATLGDISIDNPPTYTKLIQILTKRFAPENQIELYRSQIDARIRKRGEPLAELAQDIKRLVRLAYPTVTHDVRDSLAYRAFRDALNDHELEWAIVQANTETIDEALHLAIKYEAFQVSKKKPTLRYQTTENKNQTSYENQKKEPVVCYYCNKPGHIAKFCNKRKGDQKSTLDSVRNSRSNHERTLGLNGGTKYQGNYH